MIPDTVRSEIRDFVNNHFGEICLAYRGDQLVRLIGLCNSPDDYYYIVEYATFTKTQSYLSCVGHLDSMKQHFDSEMYAHVDDFFKLNGSVPRDSPIYEEESKSFFV